MEGIKQRGLCEETEGRETGDVSGVHDLLTLCRILEEQLLGGGGSSSH